LRILVTGADGFVGSRLVPRLHDEGHEVSAAVVPVADSDHQRERRERLRGCTVRELDLLVPDSVDSLIAEGWDAVVHLAAVSSGGDAARNPELAWQINTVGTVRLINSLVDLKDSGADPFLLFASTADVYGRGEPRPRTEDDPVAPSAPYPASKLAAEVAVQEAARRTGVRTTIARAFPHTGAGQDNRFVIPAFAQRIVEAKNSGLDRIRVGNLDPVRDYLHVSDVVEAYVRLTDAMLAGEVFNIASGAGLSVRELLHLITTAARYQVEARPDPELIRPADVPHLVGDSSKLRNATGWIPQRTVEQAIREVVSAQTN